MARRISGTSFTSNCRVAYKYKPQWRPVRPRKPTNVRKVLIGDPVLTAAFYPYAWQQLVHWSKKARTWARKFINLRAPGGEEIQIELGRFNENTWLIKITAVGGESGSLFEAQGYVDMHDAWVYYRANILGGSPAGNQPPGYISAPIGLARLLEAGLSNKEVDTDDDTEDAFYRAEPPVYVDYTDYSQAYSNARKYEGVMESICFSARPIEVEP